MRQLAYDSSLTEWEWQGINANYNLADGHAHHPLKLTNEDAAALLRLLEREEESQDSIEDKFAGSFFWYAKQIRPRLKPSLHYSSSISIEIAGKVLRQVVGPRVGILTPTFDNIPLLLRRCGLTLVPLPERQLADPESVVLWLDSCESIFVVQPNNPTGYVLEVSEWKALIEQCASRKVVYCCDSSFRFFDDRVDWPHYEFLSEFSDQLDYIMVEDTGKNWPLRELKVGILCASMRLDEVVKKVSEEVMLNVSPFVLSLLTRLMDRESPDDFRSSIRSIVDVNRATLRDSVDGLLTVASDPRSRLSVEWLKLPNGYDSHDLCMFANDRGTVVLPGRPFGWHKPAESAGFIRVALMREPAYFRRATASLSGIFREFTSSRTTSGHDLDG